MVNALPASVPSGSLVLAFSYPCCFHGVGNEGQALRALKLIGEAESALVHMHPVRDYAHPNPIIGE
jgi:hypothetical protein